MGKRQRKAAARGQDAWEKALEKAEKAVLYAMIEHTEAYNKLTEALYERDRAGRLLRRHQERLLASVRADAVASPVTQSGSRSSSTTTSRRAGRPPR
jgi:hypothetical protein